ncbi:MAG: helix-turn-helix transcriptional regulator, partial [Treponema sp.]|nr:helix-turn-helix transcriptional regulator [Treponema sp.]
MNREKKSEIIRQSILTAATSLFEQNGFEKTKVNDIAAKAELSKATFYAYFESKEVLLDTLLLNQLRDIISRIRELIA